MEALFKLLIPLIAILVLMGPASEFRPLAAAEMRPIDRLRSGPPLSSSRQSPAERSLESSRRQDLEGTLRRQERNILSDSTVSPSRKQQGTSRRKAGEILGEAAETRRKLNDLNDLGEN